MRVWLRVRVRVRTTYNYFRIWFGVKDRLRVTPRVRSKGSDPTRIVEKTTYSCRRL